MRKDYISKCMYQECNAELKKEKIDCLSNLEELVKERDLYLEREKVLNMNERKENNK